METHFDNLRPAHARPEGQRVITDLKSLVRESEDFLRATVGDVNEKTRETRSRLAAALERAKTTAKHWQEQTAATAKAAARQADTTIRAHPYESVGLAFGIGLLIGLLVTRR
ncbi:MAG TPA: hypothetical protein PKA41_11930 [Verrucomicrobiota bacterium]|nr:hypothetical protein [Verrucomicrobiota bacterium]